ncbi:MAG: S8 family serine peptidase [Bacteroidales bacterium]|nr:S8 family serine peptidase [Bacteroidales bacterium]
MKKILLLLVSCILCNIAFAQNNVIEKELQDVMNQKGDEMLDVSIMFKSQIDAAKLKAKAGRSNDKSMKREIVVSELKDFSSRTQSDVMSILEAEELGGKVADVNAMWIVNVINCKANRDVIYRLASHPDIAAISYNKEVHLLDNNKATEMNDDSATRGGSAAPHVIQINADDVWNQGYTGKNVIVAVLDSGTNINHYDLKDHLWVGYADTDGDGAEDDIIHGWNYISNNSNITDDFGHGTHCAGIVCGDGTVGNTVGVAPDASLMTVKIVNRAGGGSVAQMLSGVQFAVENGADVISMSLGFKNNQITAAQKKEIRDAFVSVLESGVVVCAAAGNDGENYVALENIDYPAACPAPWLHPDQKTINDGGVSSVICVGNVNAYNNLVASSSRGPVTWQDVEGYNDYPYDGTTTYGLIRPDICAPGELVYSLKHDQVNKYKYMTGTSQATPGVAGVIALMLEKNSSLTPAQICEIIETTASNKPATKNNQIGSGVVDALSAVNKVEAYDTKPYLKITRQSPTSMASGNGKTLNIYLTNQGKGVCENASATLTSDDQYITITNETISLGTIDVNASKEINFTLNVSDDAPNGHTASFTLTSTNGTLTWNEDFTIKIDSYARIVYQSSQGPIDAGNGVQLKVNMINKGTVATTANTDVTLSTNSSFVTINGSNNTATLGAMNVNEDKEATFTIDINESIPDQATINFDLYSTPNNYSVARNITYEFESELDQYGSPTDGFNGWTTFDNSPDGRNHPWWHSQDVETHRVVDIGSYHSGGGQLMSETYCFASLMQYSMPVDNFLVSPKIKATANSKIKFFARAHYGFPGERFQVAVSEASNNTASDFTTLSSYVIDDTDYSEWKEYEVDLSSYDGKEIYVAIRHYFTSEQWSAVDNGFNTYILHIDDVTLYDVIDVSSTFKYDNYSYFSITVNSDPLPAPANFTANANGSTSSIDLSWDAVNYAQRYNIYRDGKWLTSVASTVTSYTDNNLTHNTEYCYEIASVYSEIEYDHSTPTCATTVQKDYSAAVECSPQTINVDGTTAVPLVLTITNDGKNQFKSQSSYTLTCEEDEYVTITNNNDNLTNLAAGASAKKTINISVNENIPDNSVLHFNLNITSKAAATDPLYFTFDVPFEVAVENPLRAPKNIVAKEQYANSIPLLWDAAPKAASYDIYRDGVKIANTSQTMYVDNGLEKETTYCYTLKSLAENQESAFSEEVCATTLAEDAGVVVQSFNLTENGELATLTATLINKTDVATVAATTATLTSLDPYVTIFDGTAELGIIGVGETATAEFSVKLDASIPENHDIDFNIVVETEDLVEYIQYTFDSNFEGWTNYIWNTDENYTWEYDAIYKCVTSYSYKNGNRNADNLICSPVKIKMSNESQVVWDVASSYSNNGQFYKEHYKVYITTTDPEGSNGWDKDSNELGDPICEKTLTTEHKNFNFVRTTADASSATGQDVWVVFRHNCTGQDRILVDNIKITNVLMPSLYYNTINITPSAPEPVKLTATADGIDKVNLSWNVVARAESYNIYRNNEFLANTTETSYTDNDLTHNTTYSYKVAAESNDVEYSHSELVSVTTEQKDYSVIVEATPQTVDVLGLTTVTLYVTIFNDGANEIDSEYTLTCDDYVVISDNAAYIESLQYGEEVTETIEVKIKKNVPDNHVLVFNLNLLSMDIPFEIEVSNPSRIPENIVVNSGTDLYSLTLSWDKIEGATNYNIYRNDEFAGSTSSTSYTDKGLDASSEYCYKVTSILGTVESDYSDEVCANTSTLDGKVIVQSYDITEVGNAVTLTATLVNNTTEATPEGTTATLSCNDNYITIDNTTVEVGSIAVGGTKDIEYTFVLADNTPSNHNIDFNVIVESAAVTSDLTYNFDSSGEDWYCHDFNGDKKNWEYDDNNGYYISYSFQNGSGSITPDNLLISPQSMSITANTKLRFEVSSISTGGCHYERYGVFIAEKCPAEGWAMLLANDISMVPNSAETLQKPDIQKREIDLSSYAGKNIWIMFRHYDCSNQYAIVIDNVEITNVTSGSVTAYTSSLSATVNSSTNMFIGTGSWATASNWSKGYVPKTTDDVIVKGNVTIENGDITVNSLVVYNEASITINDGAKLTVNGTFVNTDKDFLILNDGAQLVQHSDKVKATFNMSIVNPSDWESTMNKDGWQFVSSPFEDAAINQFVGTNTHYDLYKYNGDEDDEWRNYKSTSQEFASGIFDQGEGHLLSHKNMSVVALSGTLNNSDSYTWIGLSYDENKDLANFHLLGNPFSFDMDWNNVTINNIVDGYAMLDAVGGSYVYYNEGSIPVGDGFFVKTKAEDASVRYGTAKRDKEEHTSVNLIATGNAGSDNLIISLSGAEKEGFNKLENFDKDIANIYVEMNNKRYGIANFDSDVNVVNVAFEAYQIGNYTISAQPKGNFNEITLIDRFTGIETNLLMEGYNFTATSRDNYNRFIVKLKVNGQQTTDNSQFVYQSGEELILGIEGKVQIIDMMGRTVYSEDVTGTNNRINVSNFNDAAYVVRVITDEGVKTQKIVID